MNIGKALCRRERIQQRYYDDSQGNQLNDNDFTGDREAITGLAVTRTRTNDQERNALVLHGRFPVILHNLLQCTQKNGEESIISWQVHGRAFKIHNIKEFEENIMPRYFKQTKFRSFHRQLNLYGFLRITQGRDKGAYYHTLFLRGNILLARNILREKGKSTEVRPPVPDFYSMPYMIAEKSSPTITDCINLPHINDVSSKCSSSSNSIAVPCDSILCNEQILRNSLDAEPDAFPLEIFTFVQFYSVEECNLIFRICKEMDATSFEID